MLSPISNFISSLRGPEQPQTRPQAEPKTQEKIHHVPSNIEKKSNASFQATVRILCVGPIVTLCTHPLDTAAQRVVKNTEANPKVSLTKTPFAGAGWIIGLRTVSRSIVFGVQDSTKKPFETFFNGYGFSPDQSAWAAQMSSSVIAGFAESCVHPLGLLVTRIQTGGPGFKMDARQVAKFFREEHPWRGIQYTAMRDILASVVVFNSMAFYRGFYPKSEQDSLCVAAKTGFASGFTAGFLTAYPAAALNQIARGQMPNPVWHASTFRAMCSRPFALASVVAGMNTGMHLVKTYF